MSEELIRRYIDEAAIRRTLARYAYMNDGRNAEGYASLFAEEAKVETRSRGTIQGRAAIKEFIQGTFDDQGRDGHAKHLCGNAVIDLHGDLADATIDVVEYRSSGGGPWVVHNVGRYHDRLVRRGDEWLFLERQFVPDH